jgi:hypothetical protein
VLLVSLPPWQNAHQMPHDLCQWLVYILVVVVGVFVSSGTQWLFTQQFLNPIKTAQEAHERVKRLEEKLTGVKPTKEPEWQFGHLGTGLQGWVGAIEIILYASSVVFEHPEFIAVWFATKYVAAYKTWAEEPVGRTFYNRSLFSSGLNILLGFFTGRTAMWAISHVGPH